ncbi:hypothetical protein TNCV_330191 [Trichonephila clavipes]|nr:hypothetical protein TNCV_330191 [Trichonephila clavipes]
MGAGSLFTIMAASMGVGTPAQAQTINNGPMARCTGHLTASETIKFSENRWVTRKGLVKRELNCGKIRLGGVVGLELALYPQICGFDPGPSRWIFITQKIGSIHVVGFCGMLKIPRTPIWLGGSQQN